MNRSATRPALLITGVSSGIGLGMAQKFLQEGFRVFGSVRARDKGEALRRQLGEQFTPLVFDVCKPEEIRQAEATLRESLQGAGLAGLINNAGGAEIGPLLHVPPETLQQHLDALVVGQLRVIQTFFKYLVAPGQPPGRILNITSVSGVGVNVHFGCYAAGKHALEGLSKTLREEVRNYGVKVVVIAPGNIATDIWGKQRPELIEQYRHTDYYPALRGALNWIGSSVVRDAMTVEEFTAELYRIFTDPSPRDRYTLVKGRRSRWPWRRQRAVQVTAG